MANADVMREFLVLLGFKVDAAGQKKFVDGVASATLQVLKLGTAIEAAAAAVVTGVALMADSAEKLYFMSQRTKASVENIQAFGFAMSQVGSSVGQARAAIEGMASFLRSSPGAGNLLSSLGIDPNQDPAQITQRFFEYARQIPIWRARLYASMFGIDEPTLLAGIKGEGNFFAVYQDLLRKAGLNTTEAANDAHGFMVELRTLFATLDILGQKTAAGLYGPLGRDIARVRALIVDNFDIISREIIGLVRGVVALAEIFTTLLIRAGQAIAGIIDWFDHLDPKLKQVIATFGAIYAAWRLLNAGFLATPLGMIASLLTALLLLYDDYRVWKEGGKSLIDWAAWEPYIIKAKEAITWIADHLADLTGKTQGFQNVALAMAAVMGTIWASRMVAAFATVGASMLPLLAGMAALAGFADITARPFGNIASTADERKQLNAGRAAHGEAPLTQSLGNDLTGGAIRFFMSPAGGNWTLAQASGIVAQIASEDPSWDPHLTNSSGHTGLFQTSQDRQRALEASHPGWGAYSTWTREQQLAGAAWELEGPEHNAGDALRGAGTARGAGRLVSSRFERHGIASQDIERGDRADRLASHYIEPLPASGDFITIQQSNPITITGVSDPARAADLAGARQDRSNGDLLRNFTGSAR